MQIFPFTLHIRLSKVSKYLECTYVPKSRNRTIIPISAANDIISMSIWPSGYAIIRNLSVSLGPAVHTIVSQTPIKLRTEGHSNRPLYSDIWNPARVIPVFFVKTRGNSVPYRRGTELVGENLARWKCGASICARYFVRCRCVQRHYRWKPLGLAGELAMATSRDKPAALFHPLALLLISLLPAVLRAITGITHFPVARSRVSRRQRPRVKHALYGKICQDLVSAKERTICCSRRWFIALLAWPTTIFFNAATSPTPLSCPTVSGWSPIDRFGSRIYCPLGSNTPPNEMLPIKSSALRRTRVATRTSRSSY